MINKRDFCIGIMEKLDIWGEEQGFEVSGYDVAEFAEMAYQIIEEKEIKNGKYSKAS